MLVKISLLDHAKQFAIGALKTSSNRVTWKTAEATGNKNLKNFMRE